jgi:predicted PurR-regulated permease PerM
MREPQVNDMQVFKNKVWAAVGIVAFAVIGLWIFAKTFNVLLLVLIGILIAIFFHGLSGLIRKYTGIKKGSLLISILLTVILLVLFFWLAGNSVQQQVNELSQTLPAAIENAKEKLNNNTIGKKITDQAGSAETKKKLSGLMQTFFKSTFGVLGDLYVVIIIGIFFTAGYRTYLSGLMKLFPAGKKQRAQDIIEKAGDTLKKWLKGQLFAMLVVAVLTAIGLFILGVPMALTLALIAGILNFIPNFGPLIAIIPAALISFMQGPTTALIVIALYMVVQILESSIITPQIQKKMINMPPALIIIAQLVMGIFAGVLGLVLATPIIAIVIVLVNELYVKDEENKESLSAS